jgi:O-antigen ligase
MVINLKPVSVNSLHMKADTLRNALTLIGLGIVLLYAVLQDGGVPVDQWHYCLLGFGLVCSAYWIFARRQDSFKYWWVLLLLPCYALIQFFAVSVKPPATFEHLLRILAFTLVFLTIRNMKSRAAALPIIIVAALEAVIGLSGMTADGGAHGTYVNRNHFAGLLEMALPLAIMGALRFSRWLWIPAGIIFAGIVCSYSRGGFLTTLSVLALMGIMLAGSKWTGWRRWTAAAPILAGALFLFLYLPPDPFFQRFAGASEEQLSTLGGRMLFLKQAPPLIEKYAAFGSGLGGFESAFYRIKDILPGYTVDYAHNDYVQALVELGLAGFVIVALLIGGALRSAIRAEHIACVGAISAILLHSFFDFNLYIPANAMVLAWVAGLAGCRFQVGSFRLAAG